MFCPALPGSCLAMYCKQFFSILYTMEGWRKVWGKFPWSRLIISYRLHLKQEGWPFLHNVRAKIPSLSKEIAQMGHAWLAIGAGWRRELAWLIQCAYVLGFRAVSRLRIWIRLLFPSRRFINLSSFVSAKRMRRPRLSMVSKVSRHINSLFWTWIVSAHPRLIYLNISL